jgi:type III secretion protein J
VKSSRAAISVPVPAHPLRGSLGRAASLLGVLALLSGAAVTTACTNMTTVVHGLDEFEANEILVVLEAKGIGGDKLIEEGRQVAYSVAVPGVDVQTAMRILVANRLPRSRSMGLKEVYPAGGGGLIPTRSEEKAKFLMAMQGEVERKLKALPGVVHAHVSIVVPDKDIVRDLDTPPPPATAAVGLVYNPIDERGTASVTEPDVQRLVAASVEDLKAGNVQVVMKRNLPMNLVDIAAEGGSVDAPVAAASVLGIRVADKRSAAKAMVLLGIFGVVAVLGIAVGIGGIARSIGLNRRLQRTEAQMASMQKAGRATQTGLQQPG